MKTSTARTFAVLAALLLGTSSCALVGGDEEAVDAAADSTESTESTESTAVDSTTTSEAATTTEAASTDGDGTLASPRSILNGTFTYTEDFYDTDWAGELYGLVEVPIEGYSDVVGTCLAVVGVISPTRIGEGSVSEGFTAPDLGLVVEGVLVDEGFDCDTDELRTAGYGPLYDAQVTEGTEFAFYEAFLVEGDPAPSPRALILGDGDSAATVYFTTDVIPTAPTPQLQQGAGAGGDVSPLLGATFEYRGEFDDTTWQIEMLGVIEADKGGFTDEDGSCLVAFGTITPTRIDVGQLSDGFDAPVVAVLAGGTVIEDASDCDVDAVEDAGYADLWDAEVTLGTVYPFFADFFVPAGLTAESIIVGDPTEDDGARFFSIDLVSAAPPADTSASLGTLPEGITPVTGAGFTYSDGFSGTTWEALIDGLVQVEVDSFYDDEVGRCFAVVGAITATEIEDGELTDGFDTPDFGLIAGGRSSIWNGYFCDDEALKVAGYQELTEAEVTVGTVYPYFVTFFVPGDDSIALDSVFVGDGSDDGALYFDAALLDAVPSRN